MRTIESLQELSFWDLSDPGQRLSSLCNASTATHLMVNMGLGTLVNVSDSVHLGPHS